MFELLLRQTDAIRSFLHAGGPVLWIILGVAAVLAFMVSERYWYLWRVTPGELRAVLLDWQQIRRDNIAGARSIRDALISQARIRLAYPLPLVKTLVAVCPLLGLLGTVSGMIEVFDTVAAFGTGNARAMAAGISRATLPTMAGMVVALPGLYFCLQLEQQVNRRVEHLADQLRLH